MKTYLRNAMPLLVAALSLTNAQDASAQAAPPLGTVQQFSVLGGSGVSGSTGAGTIVTGDVGSFPTCFITNFPPSTVAGGGFVLHGPVVCDGTVPTARADATAAFLALNQGVGTVIADQLAGQSLPPAVYTFTTTTADIAGGGTLTLTGGAGSIYVFRTGSTLTANVTSAINFGAVNPCNVYWQVGSSATINANFGGNIFASASVTIGSGANLTGRAIAGTGAVTMAGGGGNTIGGCATPQAVPTPTPTPTPVPPGPPVPPVPTLPQAAAGGLLALLVITGTLVLARR